MKKLIYTLETILFCLVNRVTIKPGKKILISLFCCIFTSLFCKANAQVGLFIRPNSSSLSSPVNGQTWFFNSTNYTTSVWNGSAFQLTSAPLNNFTAMANPTIHNDNTEGYSPASLWYNTSNGNTYECVDATTSAAIWIQTNNLGGLTIPLSQLATTGASTGQSIIFNGTNWTYGSPNILLSQVLQSGASTGQVPVWNGSAWVPGTTSGGGAVALSQITQSGAVTGDGIQWNGSTWVSANVCYPSAGEVDNKIATWLSGNPALGYGFMSANSRTYTAGINEVQNSDPSFIYCDSSSGSNELDLPAANSVIGKVYCFIPINFDNIITVVAYSGDDILAYGSSTQITQLVDDPASNNAYPLILESDGNNQWIQITPVAPVLVGTQNSNFDALGNTSYYIDTSSGAVVATLPDATECMGQVIKFKIVNGGNALTFSTTGGQTLDGSSSPSQSLSNTNDYMIIESDGSNWWIFGYNNS